MNSSDLMGAWALVSFVRHRGDKSDDALGPKPTGLLLYTPDGFMAAYLHKDPAVKWEGELLSSYSGRWTMEGNTLQHAVMFNTEADRVGQVQVRHARLDGPFLVLSTDKKDGPKGPQWLEITWKRP